MLRYLVFFYAAVLWGAEVVQDTRTLPYLNPAQARREVEKIRLENGLEAYLVSDPEAEDAGVALTVRAGSWDEPVTDEGLAHFLEHMLFMGTEEYPIESDYDAYLSRYRGQSNAFTYSDITAYMFSIKKEGFQEALKRFSSFFKAPLFNPSGVDREVKAIDQEFRMNAEKDSFLRLQVMKTLAKKEHPFARFSSGNKESLKNASRDELKAWYETHYSPERMRLWIFSPLSIEAMKDLVEQDFGTIPVRELKETAYPEEIIASENYGKLIKMRPIQEERTLSLMWELPPSLSTSIDEKPWSQIAWILGNEGENSLLAQLRREGLANELSAADLQLSKNKRLFFVDIELTPLGQKEWKTVSDRVFQAIQGIKKEGVSEALFNTIRHLEALNYQWMAPTDTFSEAMSNAFIQAYEPLSSYPEKTYVSSKYSKEKLDQFLQLLVPEKAVYLLLTPDIKDPKEYRYLEKWTETPFSIEDVDVGAFGNGGVNAAIKLPAPNPYLPERFEVKNKEEAVWNGAIAPELVSNTDKGKFYFLQDPYYQVPQGYVSFEVKTPLVTSSIPKSVVLRDLWLKAYQHLLSGPIYDAKLAGLNVGLDGVEEGVRFTVYGYTDKLANYLKDLEKAFTLEGLDGPTFQRLMNDLSREYANLKLETPIKQAIEGFKSSIYRPYATIDDKLSALSRVNLDTFKAFSQNLFQASYTAGAIYGNFERKEALSIWESWTSALGKKGFAEKDQKPVTVVDLPPARGPFKQAYPIAVQGNAMILGVEGAVFTAKERGVEQLLQQVVDKSFFKELRTRQQTGYLVATVAQEIKEHLFTLFLIQSATLRAEELLWRTESFLDQFVRDLGENLKEADFETYKKALLDQLKEKPKSQDLMGDLLVQEAFELKGNFNWIKQRIEALEKLTYQEFLEAAKDYLGRANRRRLVILAEGQNKNLFQYKTYEPNRQL